MRIDHVPDFEPVRFLCRPMPIDGESWPDYVIRLAETNFIEGGLRAIAYLAGMYVNQLLVAAPSEVLLRFGVILPEVLKEHPLDAPSDHQLAMLASHGRCTKTRFCPLCLAADDIPFIRTEWGMPMSIACGHHRTLLIDKCQSCGERLDVLRTRMLYCECGVPLKKQVPMPAEPWVDQLRELFAEAYGAQDFSTFGRAHPLAQKAARVCKWLVQTSDPETGRRPMAGLMDGFLTSEHAHSMGRILNTSTSGIAESLMAEVRSESIAKYQSLKNRLGVRDFFRMTAVVDEVKRLQMQFVDPNRRRVERRAEVMERSDVYALTDVTALTGYCHSTLAHAVEKGYLAGSIAFDEVLKRDYIQIPGEVYRAIASSYQETDSIETSAVRAGCTVQAMKRLVHAECIGAYRLLPIRLGPSGTRVQPADLQELMRRLFHAAEFESEHRFRRVYFSDWVSSKNLIKTSRKWRRMLAAIKEGRIRIFKAVEHPTALEELYVAPADLVKVLDLRAAPRVRRVSRPTQPPSW
ncbi:MULTISPECIES: TniQ family protein [unclassified Variovorax]|uniref:TniQ family protein n=1 Tax=unclassified Variovorax TaxID=663243 RepID=UPI003F44A365